MTQSGHSDQPTVFTSWIASILDDKTLARPLGTRDIKKGAAFRRPRHAIEE